MASWSAPTARSTCGSKHSLSAMWAIWLVNSVNLMVVHSAKLLSKVGTRHMREAFRIFFIP